MGVGDGWEREVRKIGSLFGSFIRAPRGLWLAWSAWELPLVSWTGSNIFYAILELALGITLFSLSFSFFKTIFNLNSPLNFGLRVVFFGHNYPSIIIIFHRTCLCYLCSNSLFSFIIVAEMTKLVYPQRLLGFFTLRNSRHVHTHTLVKILPLLGMYMSAINNR